MIRLVCVDTMIPSLVNLNIGGPTTRSVQEKRFTHAQPRAITKPKALERKQSNPQTQVFTDVIDRCDHWDGAYTSISKDLHRQRIVNDMRKYSCQTGRTPSLVYLAAPDGSDSHYFQRQIQTHVELRGTRLVAVNKKFDINLPPNTDKMQYVADTLENYMQSVESNSFTHAWLDTTSQEIDNELLWNTCRSTLDKIYLVVSLRGNSGYRSYEDSSMILKSQCEFFGLTIKHQEAYAGITPNGDQSSKINMVFMTCLRTKPTKTDYDKNYNAIGALVDVKPDAINASSKIMTTNIFLYGTYYIGLVKGYTPSTQTWLVQFFDQYGNLLPQVFTIARLGIIRTSIFSKSYFMSTRKQ